MLGIGASGPDSNRRPAVYKTAALPPELRRRTRYCAAEEQEDRSGCVVVGDERRSRATFLLVSPRREIGLSQCGVIGLAGRAHCFHRIENKVPVVTYVDLGATA
jgi:hypothetical protein